MADRDPQIDNITDPKLKKLAEQSRTELKVDFGMTRHTGVNLETFARLVRDELRAELAATEPSSSAKPPKP